MSMEDSEEQLTPEEIQLKREEEIEGDGEDWSAPT